MLLPGGDDGPQAACALLPCEIGVVIPDFQFQDLSDGGWSRLLLCRPGLHDDCPLMSSSLSLVDGNEDIEQHDVLVEMDR